MEELEIDIMGMAETNRPWSKQQKAVYDAYMMKCFRTSRTIYTAAPAQDHQVRYQPGGNLLTVNGEVTARIDGRGSDALGRFCYYTFAGKRDEGVLVIVAYRVCQEVGNATGPYTAFNQQYIALRNAGQREPNPRKQILMDIEKLIAEHRARGYRPILLIDANGDYQKGKDKDLLKFMDGAQLTDPYAERFGHTRTFIRGSSRIDYILMDRALIPSIKRIGYLGTHDGATSDHVMAYVDMDHQQMFAGTLNKPPPATARDILIEQEDKVQRFLRHVTAQFETHKIAERVFQLAADFAAHGATTLNESKYNKLYGEFLELVKSSTKAEGRKKFGYPRSRKLTTAGARFLLYKYANDCRCRGAPPTKKLENLGRRLDLNITELMELPREEFRRLVRKSRKSLWEVQKNSEENRMEWLITDAKAKAAEAGDNDWERRVDRMHKKMQASAVNRKLTMVTKGQRGALRMIQVPNHEWFYSEDKHELYRYHRGVFEAYPAATEFLFYTHHTRKVLPNGVQAVLVERDWSGNYWMISTILPMPTPLWRDVTAAEEIERELLQRNKMHLEQTDREGGISTGRTMTAVREDHGVNPLSRKILDGEQITEFEITEDMRAFFAAMKRTETDKALAPVLGTITSTEFQEMFTHAKEKTSSDSRTPNYTIWKCLAKSDVIAGFASVLLSLPFVYGFPNAHWTHMTDFMLEKKPGMRQIHMLRIIGKLAAEFNTCLKLIIGKRARDNFEKSEACDEQHGFRPHRSAQDAMMLKLLTYECARMQKCTIGSIQHDMTAHFDRMQPENSTVLAMKYGVAQEIMKSIGATIAALKRNVETFMGVSEGTYQYQQIKGDPKLGGMVQGKADIPQLSTQQSDAMLRAHKSRCHGVNITSPGLHRAITHHSIAYADDTDGQVSTDTTEDTMITKLVRKLQHSGQTWSNLTSICGGLIAHHKCFWQLLAWDTCDQPRLRTDIEDELILNDGKGAYTRIDYLGPDEPNVGLGFHLCPSGNQNPHFEATLRKMTDLCRATAAAYLTETEANQLIRQRLNPKLSYALHGTSFTEKQCGKINSLIRTTFLPITRFNRNFPSAVLYGPMDYGGMEFIEAYTLQDQVQLDYLIKQLRWDRVVANDFMVALDSVQMCSGFVEPILESVEDVIDFLSPSYIISLRNRLREMKAYVWIEKSWTPKLQREGDRSIMQVFVQCPNISRAMLRQANAVRLYLRVVTIADLADVGGSFIPAGMLTGKWTAGTDLKWPYQPKPTSAAWSTFRRCLRLTFCTNTPPYSRPSHSLDLDTRLGRWLDVKRNTWFQVYRSKTDVIWRDEEEGKLFQMKPSTVSGFHHIAQELSSLPLESHPVRFKRMGDVIWTHGKYLPAEQCHPTRAAGHVIENTLVTEDMEMVTLGSDGSVHLFEGLAACAWVIHQTEGQHLKACYVLENMASISSYRSELEGMYRGLVDVKSRLTPVSIRQWCDNKAAVDKYNLNIYTPSQMIAADADVILAIKHVSKQLAGSTKIVCKHIYGHQDSKSRIQAHTEVSDGTESDKSEIEFDELSLYNSEEEDRRHKPMPLSLEARINIDCDRIATETIDAVRGGDTHGLPPVMKLPYEGSRALLNIDGKWITAHQNRHIVMAKWGQKMKEYCCHRFRWDDQQFDSVLWSIVRSVRKNITATEQMKTSKIMHGWLPVNHMQGHVTGITQCPCCPHPDETMEHMFKCTNRNLMEKKDELINDIRKKGMAKGIPRAIMEAVCHSLYDFVHSNTLTIPENPILAAAVESQNSIGLRLLPRGILSEKWLTALREFGVAHPERKMAGLLRLIWFDFTDVIWRNRNERAHERENNVQQAENTTWANKLSWYLRNRHVIARRDQFIMNYTEEDIVTMPGFVRRKMVQNLERLEAVYAREVQLLAMGQRTITSYFSRVATQENANVETASSERPSAAHSA